MDAADLITTLHLVPLLPEGGHVAETWRSDGSSAILYLVERPDFSAFHRLRHVEIWAWHAGSPLHMLLLGPAGEVRRSVLGMDLGAGQRPQVVVPPGWWQAAEPAGPWALASTFMSPPYTEEAIEFGRADDLAGANPALADDIRRLSRF